MATVNATILRSSEGRGWAGLGAELRKHTPGLIEGKNVGADTRLAISVGRSSSAVLRRLSGKNVDAAAFVQGTVWVCPARIKDGIVEATAATPEVLHIWMPRSTFDQVADDSLRGVDPYEYVSYVNGHVDPLMGQCGIAITQELYKPTSAGRILVESLANTIAARLVHINAGSIPDGVLAARSGLDSRRLRRVLEAIDAGLEEDLTIARLASVACLSPFHFARAFKASMGMPPHKYVSVRRLHHAKDLVMGGVTPLSQIAVSLGFSSQSNFNRAFRAATGMTPTAYKLALMN